jgi:nucleoside phosphorylase
MSNEVNILIVTVTEVETSAVIKAFEQATGIKEKPRPIGDRIYSDLGTINNVRFFLTRSEMGSNGLGGSQNTVSKGINALSPISVIMVGIAYGFDDKKQSIGDILVAEQLLLYGLQRLSTHEDGQEKIIVRGDKSHASPWLINRFKHASQSFHDATVKFGVVVTDDKLIDNINRRDQIRRLETEAIGGEMEGAGLYVACHDKKVDWILVKSICDWACNKGEDKKSRQLIAAQNAAAFLLHTLQFAPLIDDELTDTSYGVTRKRDSIKMNRADLSTRLEKYTDSQLKEIINEIDELRVNKKHIHMNGTSYVIISDLLDILEANAGGLQLLQETLKKKMILR